MKEEILAHIVVEMDKAWNLLQQIPERDQRFRWQEIANLRGMFRDGPNNSGRPIDSRNPVGLQAILYDLDQFNSEMRNWLNKNPRPVNSAQRMIPHPKNPHAVSPYMKSETMTAKDRLKQTCPCCGQGLTVFIVKKPAFRVTAGCRKCGIFENEQGELKTYVGEITYV